MSATQTGIIDLTFGHLFLFIIIFFYWSNDEQVIYFQIFILTFYLPLPKLSLPSPLILPFSLLTYRKENYLFTHQETAQG